ncbi:ribose 5-phosphate isomerase A [Hamiltosporidium magnivora]|uniref:Ribose-5-phosphate isomerase n=1 Tax=Hamiltosporidium magnivora TaxID=148818 RepID=A0A4Q9L736_9MICR|nr:ribose 5-phosphate isomerase A [Hamiltosporidium magnivora]
METKTDENIKRIIDIIYEKYITKQKYIGIGTGRTIEILINHLKNKNIENILFIPTSLSTMHTLNLNKFKISQINLYNTVDLYIDGADYYNKDIGLIKGKGGALTMEKLLAKMSTVFVAVIQKEKIKETFDDLYVPIEILPEAFSYIVSILEKEKIIYSLRQGTGKYGPTITENGNLIFDVKYNLEFLKQCKKITGIVEHGLFLKTEFNIKIVTL